MELKESDLVKIRTALEVETLEEAIKAMEKVISELFTSLLEEELEGLTVIYNPYSGRMNIDKAMRKAFEEASLKQFAHTIEQLKAKLEV